MLNGRGLGQRLDRLEEHAIVQAAHAEAERIGGLVACAPDILLERAQAISELVAVHGTERTIELVAAGVGLSPESLESRAHALSCSEEQS